jgi:hypothetical protein
LSVPAKLRDSPLNTPDSDSFSGAMVPGAPAANHIGATDVLRQALGAARNSAQKT